jgi:hypothetical protein
MTWDKSVRSRYRVKRFDTHESRLSIRKAELDSPQHARWHTINIDGTGLVRLTDHEERDDYAAWHPNGKSVVFVGERNGKFDLYSVTVK